MEPNFKFNWGAFFMPIQFGFANKAWRAFLCLIPFVGFIFQIIGGFQGARWAYESGEFNTVEEFNAVMKSWNRAGILTLIVTAVIVVLYIAMFASIMAMLGTALSNI